MRLAGAIFGWRVCLSGGTSNNGAQAGVGALNANNDSANANTNIGSHLSFNREVRRRCLLAKNKKQNHYGTGSYGEGSRLVKANYEKV